VEIRRAAAVLVLLLLAGCGTGHRPARAGEWQPGALLVIAQLRRDVVAVAGADRLPAARAALADESQLYGLLISFSDVAGCRHMVSTLGVTPPAFAAAERLLDRACRPLQRAGELFTRAASRHDSHALVAAAGRAAAALPLLDRARLALARL
jgi:hypothetical protein